MGLEKSRGSQKRSWVTTKKSRVLIFYFLMLSDVVIHYPHINVLLNFFTAKRWPIAFNWM